MKTLIVYYTRTNTTKKLAENLARELGADVEVLVDKQNYSGAIGYLKAGRKAATEKLSELEEHKYDPANYDLVLLGTPVWVGRMTPAVRTYITNHKQYFKNVAFFTTQGGGHRQRVFDNMKDLVGKKPKAELLMRTKEVVKDEGKEKIEEFIRKISG